MKKLLLSTLAACLIFSMAFALPHPERYKVAFGNPDGSPMTVGINQDIEVPCWGHTDPDDFVDTVAAMFIPLKSANSIITSRTGGSFPPDHVGRWDLHFITNPVPNPYPGGTDSISQGILGIADLGGGTFDPVNAFWFGDDQFHLIGTFLMHTANDLDLIGTTPCPFGEGFDPANGHLLFGFADGLSEVIPLITISCLYFSPTGINTPAPLPRETALLGAYPNPFNSSTTIRFSLSTASDVVITIYNITGQLMKTFSLDNAPAGEGSIVWNGTDESGGAVSSGVYFYRMEAGAFRATSHATLLK